MEHQKRNFTDFAIKYVKYLTIFTLFCCFFSNPAMAVFYGEDSAGHTVTIERIGTPEIEAYGGPGNDAQHPVILTNTVQYQLTWDGNYGSAVANGFYWYNYQSGIDPYTYTRGYHHNDYGHYNPGSNFEVNDEAMLYVLDPGAPTPTPTPTPTSTPIPFPTAKPTLNPNWTKPGINWSVNVTYTIIPTFPTAVPTDIIPNRTTIQDWVNTTIIPYDFQDWWFDIWDSIWNAIQNFLYMILSYLGNFVQFLVSGIVSIVNYISGVESQLLYYLIFPAIVMQILFTLVPPIVLVLIDLFIILDLINTIFRRT